MSQGNTEALKEEALAQRLPFMLSIIFMGFILKLVLQLCIERKKSFRFDYSVGRISSDGSEKGSIIVQEHLGELVT